MLRKILAAVFSLSMVLAAAPVVQAEAQQVTEISSALELNTLLNNGGNGKLMSNITDSSYTYFNVNHDASIDMNGFNISGDKFEIGNNIKLNLTGSGSINADSGIDLLANGQIHAENTVNFTCVREGTPIILNNDSLLNGGTYSMSIQGISSKDKPGVIANGVFNGAVKTANGATGIVINGGTFNNTISSQDGGGTFTINGGTFNSDVSNSIINGGTFNNGTIRNSTIYGGTFNGGTIDPSCIVKKDINQLTISDVPAQTYNGADLTPAVSIKDGNKDLVKDTDYTVTYSANHNVGTGHITVTGTGSYDGTVEKTFTILPRQIVLSGITVNDKIYDGTDKAAVNTGSAVLNGKAEGDDLTVDVSGAFADPDAGSNKTVNLTLTLKGSAAGNYVLAYGNQQTATASITKADPALSVEAVATKTYSDHDFQLNVSHKGDGQVTYSSDKPDVLSVSNTGLVHIAGAGTANITVNLAESKNYKSASDTLTINVDKANGNIRIQNAVINKTYGDADFSVKPLDTTPGTITYRADGSGVVSVDGVGNVHINKPGTAVITISMDATGNHHAVSETITVNVTVSRQDPALSVEAVATKTYSDQQFQLNVTHKSDGIVSYSSSDPNVLTVDANGLVSIVNAGTATVTVSLPETDKYNAASDTLTINVDKANGNIRIQNAVINKTYGDADFSVKPSDTTPGTIRYTADGSGVVSVDGVGNVHINKAGTAVITISMDATGNHHAVSEIITVNVAEAPSVDQNNYVITTGNKNYWQRGSGKQLVIISDGDYDLFNGLYIDGSQVDRKNYDVKKGSTEIYLNPSYLETLSDGRHTFELKYSNGRSVSGEFTIVETEKPVPTVHPDQANVKKEVQNKPVNKNEKASSVPDTGDHTNNVAWGFAMVAAMICAVGVVITRKKRMN